MKENLSWLWHGEEKWFLELPWLRRQLKIDIFFYFCSLKELVFKKCLCSARVAIVCNQLKAITNLWPSICCLCEKFVKIIFWGCCLQPSWQWAKADKTARTNVRKFLTLSNSSNWLSLDIRTIINKIAQVNLKQTN